MSRVAFLILIFWSICSLSTAQSNSRFWKGLLSSSQGQAAYAVVNDSLYRIDGGTWLFKAYLNSGNNVLNDLKVNNNVLWAFYSSTIKYSPDEGNTWQLFSKPSDASTTGKFYGNYIYLNGAKVYRKNIVASNSSWETIYNGGCYDFAVTVDSTIYLTFYDFRIIKSTDNGLTWNETNWASSGEQSTPCTIEAQYNKIFVGTYWGGLYLSNDGGNNWLKSTGLPVGKGVSNIYLNSDSLVIVLVRDQLSTPGLYISSNDGVDFVKLNCSLTRWTEEFIEGFVRNNNNMFLSAGYRGFLKSTDTGNSWSDFNNGIDNIKPHHVIKIQMDPGGSIWTLMSETGIGPRNTWGILKSTDNSISWSEADSTLIDQYMTLEDLLVIPNGKAIVSRYSPGKLSISTDAGNSWVSNTVTGIASTISSLQSNNSNDIIFAGTYWDGVLRSIDGGLNWEKLTNGLPNHIGASSIVIDNDTVYTIIKSQSGYDGIYRSLTLGNSWQKISSEYFNGIIKNGNSLYGYQGHSIYKSNDEGSTWENISNNLPSNLNINAITIAINISEPSLSAIVLATTSGIYCFNPFSSIWAKLSDTSGNTLLWDNLNNCLIIGNDNGINKINASQVFIHINPLQLIMGANAGTCQVNISSLTAWQATSNNDWLTINGSNNGSPGIATLTLNATENNTSATRTASVTISATGFENQTITISQCRKITVSAGTLNTVLTSEEKNTLTNITLVGAIDARDFKTMRDSMPALNVLDIRDVMISAYYGNLGTQGTNSFTYLVNSIPQYAFLNPISHLGKSSLNTIILPFTISKIGWNSFNSCNGLTSFHIPSSVTSIDQYAYAQCSSLDSIILPTSVVSIGWGGFYGCTGLSFVFIPASVTYIGIEAFSNCGGDILVSDSNQFYSSADGVLFNKTKTSLLSCPKSKNGNFSIPSSVNIISQGSFIGCSGLNSITIPYSVTSVGGSAFEYCYGLTSIGIPSSVTSIESYAFYDCRNIDSIYAYSNIPINISSSYNVFYNINKSSTILLVPIGSVSAYQAANQWKDFLHIVEMQPQPSFQLSGSITYNNASNTPLGSVKLSIQRNSIPIDSTLTNETGAYSFSPISSGNYASQFTCTKPWSGVNGTDALKVQRHVAGIELITEPIRLLAADVNNTGSINATDALKIKRRVVGMDTSFTTGNWIFAKPVIGGNNIIVNGVNTVQNFYGICVGDVNGSNVPGPGAKSAASLELIYNGTILPSPGQEFEIQLTTEEDLAVSAVSLVLSYPADLISVSSLSMKDGSPVYTISDGKIRLAWSEVDPMKIAKVEPLLTMKVRIKENFKPGDVIHFTLGSESELADESAEVISGVNLEMPEIGSVTSIEDPGQACFICSIKVQPNPAKGTLKLEFDLTKNSDISIGLYDLMGKEVKRLKTSSEKAGRIRKQLDVSGFANGTYFLKIHASGPNQGNPNIVKIIIQN
ncbi:MAG: leucine-rich repeat protein [Bacteroidetes bacterium]|nr:leucine-rich repeat protein [Bacteroidota bacterium]